MNPYEQLGVSKDATKAEIKKAYKKAASASHPDKEGGDHEMFQTVKLAYDVLSDPDSKAHYDQTGKIKANEIKADPVEQRMTQLFTSMIDEEKFTGNIIDKAIDIVRDAIGELITVSCNVETSLEKLNKRIGRIKCKDENNMYEIVLSGKVSELTNRLTKMDDEHKIMEGVLERLSNYSDEAPEVDGTIWRDQAWPGSL